MASKNGQSSADGKINHAGSSAFSFVNVSLRRNSTSVRDTQVMVLTGLC
jgi:hypothetical protein